MKRKVAIAGLALIVVGGAGYIWSRMHVRDYR